VSKRTIKLADLLGDAPPPPTAPAGPKILLGVLDDAGERPAWRRHFRKLIAAIPLIMILGVGFAVMPELMRSIPARTEVPLKMIGSLLVVPVEINGATTLDFTVDSGASTVVVPANVFSILRRAGSVKETDIVGQGIYILADGSKRLGTNFRIRSLKVGNIVLENVAGSVTSSEGSLLLGQSFLGRFKSWSLDNTNRVLLLELTASHWTLVLKRLSGIGCEKMTRLAKWTGLALPNSVCMQ
jgi:hypothetical protein